MRSFTPTTPKPMAAKPAARGKHEHRTGSGAIGRVGEDDPPLRGARTHAPGAPDRIELPALRGARCPYAALHQAGARPRVLDVRDQGAGGPVAEQGPIQRRGEEHRRPPYRRAEGEDRPA